MKINEKYNDGLITNNKDKIDCIVKNNENINKLKSNSKENEIFISAKRLKFGKKFFNNFYLKRVKKLIEKGYNSFVICGLGSLSELAVTFSNFVILSIPKLEIKDRKYEDIEVFDFITKNDDNIKIVSDNLDLIDDLINSNIQNENENEIVNHNLDNISKIKKSEVGRLVKLIRISIYKS